MRKTNRKIKSLRDLRKRKSRLKKEMLQCERVFVENYFVFRSPLVKERCKSAQGSDGNSFFDTFYRLTLNAKRVTDIYRLLSSIYSDYKRDK